MSQVDIEASIGRKVRFLRSSQGLSQEELGRRLAPLVGKVWSRSTVSQAEGGNRAFVAAELVALASVLGVTASYLLVPLIEQEDVDYTVKRRALENLRTVMVSAERQVENAHAEAREALPEGPAVSGFVHDAARQLRHARQLVEATLAALADKTS